MGMVVCASRRLVCWGPVVGYGCGGCVLVWVRVWLPRVGGRGLRVVGELGIYGHGFILYKRSLITWEAPLTKLLTPRLILMGAAAH